MSFLETFLDAFRPPANGAKAGWLDWFSALSRGWQAARPAGSGSSPPPPMPAIPAETGQALTAFLDLLVQARGTQG